MVDIAMTAVNYSRPAPRAGRADWLDNWLSASLPDHTLPEQYGIRSDQFYAAVIYKLTKPNTEITPPLPEGQLAVLVQAEVMRRRLDAPVLTYRDSVVVLLPVPDPQQTQRLKRLTETLREQLATRLPGRTVCCGVGRPELGVDLRRSFWDAREAADLCSALNNGSRPTFYGDSSLYQLLRAMADPELLHRFCMNWLSPLIEYDAEQRSDLLETLRVYFDNNSNTARTASQLSIHRNTLAYRLNRIAEIARLDLDDADVRLNLQLALKARQMLSVTV
jgi:sugar diacid utilization regulator